MLQLLVLFETLSGLTTYLVAGQTFKPVAILATRHRRVGPGSAGYLEGGASFSPRQLWSNSGQSLTCLSFRWLCLPLAQR